MGYFLNQLFAKKSFNIKTDTIKKKNGLLLLFCFFSSVFAQQKNQKPQQVFTTTNKKITVYTRLIIQIKVTPTDNLSFAASKQPVETGFQFC